MRAGHRSRSPPQRDVSEGYQLAAGFDKIRRERRGGRNWKRRYRTVCLSLLEFLIDLINRALSYHSTDSTRSSSVALRRRLSEVQQRHQECLDWQLPPRREPLLQRFETENPDTVEIDSDLGESVYNESEAEEGFVPSNEPLRPSAVVLSARPSSIWDFENTGGTGSSTDRVATVESESESFDDGQPLEPLPPPPAEYLVDWEFLKRTGVTLADPAKGEIIWDPKTGDPANPPFQGKILCDQRSVFSIDFHNVCDIHRTSWRSATRYWDSVGPQAAEAVRKLSIYFNTVICSYCHSQFRTDRVVAACLNQFTDRTVKLVIITKQPTGPHGKLAILKSLVDPCTSVVFHIDDGPHILSEIVRERNLHWSCIGIRHKRHLEIPEQVTTICWNLEEVAVRARGHIRK